MDKRYQRMRDEDDEIKSMLTQLLNHHIINLDEHTAHHEWIQEQIEKDRAKKEMMWEITKSVSQWSVLGLLGGFFYYIQHGHWSA